MSLTALEMEHLADDARAMAQGQCRGYVKDALQCLRETGDPLAALELLRALWGTSHARRPDQKDALDDAGRWLEQRLVRDPGLAPGRLALELGWLYRLVAVHASGDASEPGDDRRGPPVRRRDPHPRSRDEPSFGAHLDQLRRKRTLALRTASTPAPRRSAPHPAGAASAPPTRLPDSFEASFADERDALEAFRTARKRRKDQKPVKDRPLPVRPVATELVPLTTDLACALLGTEGMDELEARAMADAGKLPSFWIAVADLVERDGKRIPRRISLTAPPASPAPDPHR